jgi:NTP pyrophosphatase (non-canonical NTP hydrolase)
VGPNPTPGTASLLSELRSASTLEVSYGRGSFNGAESNIIIPFMSNLHLKENPTLSDFQNYVAAMVKERDFGKETVAEIFMLFLEECGELAKAARKTQKIHSDKNSELFHVDHEAVDVFMYLLDICNHFDIDLEKAFREKEEINKKRTWE